MSQKTEVTITESAQEISLLDVIHFFVQHKITILSSTIIAGVVAVVVVLIMPNWYAATIKIIPPNNLIQQGNFIQTVLMSERFAENLAKRFDLAQAYQVESVDEASLKLIQHVNIKELDGALSIELEDTDPKRAQEVVNAYPEELNKFIVTMGLTKESVESKKLELRIQPLQKELDETNKELAAAVKDRPALLQIPQKTIVAKLAALKAELDFVIETDASVTKLVPNLDRTRDQLMTLLRPGQRIETNLANERYLELFSNAKYCEARIAMLQKKLLLLSVDAQANNTRVFQSASLPDKKSKPKRLLIVISVMLATALLTILWLLLRKWIGALELHPHIVTSFRGKGASGR